MITPFQNELEGAGNTDVLNPNHSCDAKSNESTSRLQGVADRMTTFNRLQRAFNSVGWNFHYLDGDACLAVHRKWQMSQVCPDLRSANALLRRVGGTV